MRRLGICLVLTAILAGDPAWADNVEGTWGILKGERIVCEGSAVLVFRAGKYYRVLPNTGYSKGRYNATLSESTYEMRGDLIIVAPAFSLSNPEGKQTFIYDRRDGGRLRVEQKQDIVFARCPKDIEPQRLTN